MGKLEGAQVPEVEVENLTPKQEAEKPTEPKEKPTVEKTYTQRDFDKAVSKGLESITRQLSERDTAIAAKTAELEEFKKTSSRKLEDLQDSLEDMKSEHQDAIKALDDPDIKTSYTDRVTLRKREREAARREKDAEDKLTKAETLVYKQGLEAKAKLLHEETGIPVKDLGECQTEDEMEVKALRYRISHPSEEKAEDEDEDKASKFDSGLSSGKADLSGLSSEERLARALRKMDKGK